MAITETTRFKLPQWSAGSDPYPGRTGFNAILKLIEDQAALAYPSGLIANRPASGAFGRFYLATDQGTGGRLYYDGGTGWVELNANGGGGPGTPIMIGGTGGEGSSNRSARADHIHTIQLATASNHGAMSAQHYDALNKATSLLLGDTIVKRTSGGHIQISSPTMDSHAATKEYVDSKQSSDLANATALPTANTLAKRSGVGTIQAETGTSGKDLANIDYVKSQIPYSSRFAEGGSLVTRWDGGQISIGSPTESGHAATRGYVDGKTWDGTDIRKTGNPIYREIITGSIPAYQTAQSGTVYTVSVNSSGVFMRFTSKLADKDNIEPLEVDPRRILSIQQVAFQRRDPATGIVPPGARVEWGVIANWEMARVPELVLTEPNPETGAPEPEGWDTNGQVAGHQVVLQWLTERVDTQEKLLTEQAELLKTQAEQLRRLQETVDGLTG